MKKTLICTVFLALTCGGIQAQTADVSHDFQQVRFSSTNLDGSQTEDFQVAGVFNHVSGNGQYAVGYDDQTLTTNTGSAFLWRSSNPDVLEQLNKTYSRVSACDVSNNGIIVGSFELRGNSTDYGISFPGYKHVDSDAWLPLPVPDQYSIRNACRQDFAEEARAITADGQVIAGTIHYRVGEKEVLGSMADIAYNYLTVWERKDDGYGLKECYTDLGKPGNNLLYDEASKTFKDTDREVNYQIFMVRDISNDGRTIVGMNVADCGGFNPAFVRDGKLYQIFSCGEEGDDYDSFNFNGGTIMTIDANGNMYGYFTDGELQNHYFVFSATNELTYLDQAVTCADKQGNRYSQYARSMSPAFDCSEDGVVLVGAGVGDLGFGPYNYPLVVTNGSSSAVENVQDAAKAGVKVDFDGTTIRLKGAWLYAQVYNAAGTRVAGGSTGASFNLSSYPAGAYIVKVATMNGVTSFKVAK